MKEDQNTLTLAAITKQYFGGDEAAMRQWMVKPNNELGQKAPISVISEPAGYIAVRAAAALTAPAPVVQ